jgi:hypothetical protein
LSIILSVKQLSKGVRHRAHGKRLKNIPTRVRLVEHLNLYKTRPEIQLQSGDHQKKSSVIHEKIKNSDNPAWRAEVS